MHPGEILGTATVLFIVVAATGVWLSIYNSLVALKNSLSRARGPTSTCC